MSFACHFNECQKSYPSQARLLKHWKKRHNELYDAMKGASLLPSPNQLQLPPPPPPPHPTLGHWAKRFIEKWKMFPESLSAEKMVSLQQGVEANDKFAIRELENMQAAVPHDFLVIKNPRPKDHQHLREVARGLLRDIGNFSPAELTPNLMEEYVEDMKIFKKQLGCIVRAKIKSALLHLITTIDNGLYQNKIGSFDHIKRLCKIDYRVYDKVLCLLKYHIYAPNTSTGKYNKRDLELLLMRFLRIHYRHHAGIRSYESSSLCRFISHQIEAIRSPIRKLGLSHEERKKKEAPRPWPISGEANIAKYSAQIESERKLLYPTPPEGFYTQGIDQPSGVQTKPRSITQTSTSRKDENPDSDTSDNAPPPTARAPTAKSTYSSDSDTSEDAPPPTAKAPPAKSTDSSGCSLDEDYSVSTRKRRANILSQPPLGPSYAYYAPSSGDDEDIDGTPAASVNRWATKRFTKKDKVDQGENEIPKKHEKSNKMLELEAQIKQLQELAKKEAIDEQAREAKAAAAKLQGSQAKKRQKKQNCEQGNVENNPNRARHLLQPPSIPPSVRSTLMNRPFPFLQG